MKKLAAINALGVNRHSGFQAGGAAAGGGGAAELNYIHALDGDTIGQAPDPSKWTDLSKGFAPVVEASVTKSSFNPSVNTILLDNSYPTQDGKFCAVSLDLGGTLPEEGFRVQYRQCAKQNNQEDPNRFSVTPTAVAGNAGAGAEYGVLSDFTIINDRVRCAEFDENGDWGQEVIEVTGSPSLGYHWQILNCEWDFTNKQFTAQVYRWNDNAYQGGFADSAAPTSNGVVASRNLRYITAYNSSGNVYAQDQQTAGFWVGALTDAFPAYNITWATGSLD